MRLKTILAALGIGALAIPAAALAGNGHGQGHGNGHGKPHNVTYVFKGTYAGGGLVTVAKGNRHVRRAELVGTDVQFDLANAKLQVADTNLDTVVDVNDVVAEDTVQILARLPKADPGAQPYAAKKLIDKTNPPEEDGEEEEAE
jgi:hypothetical protein